MVALNTRNLGWAELIRLDEIIPLIIVLRTRCSSATLTQLLPDTTISISAHVTASLADSSATNSTAPKAKYTLNTNRIAVGDQSNIGRWTQDGRQICAWRTDLHLRHPECLLHRPVVQFVASASYQPPQTAPGESKSKHDSEYLTSGVALPANLLAQLTTGPDYADKDVRLPSDRIEKLVPRSRLDQHELPPIRASSALYPIMTLLNIQTQRTACGHNQMLSVEVDISSRLECQVSFDSSICQVAGVVLDPLGDASVLPRESVVGNKHTLLYRLEHGAPAAQVTINATAVSGTTTSILRLSRDEYFESGTVQTQARRTLHWKVTDGPAAAVEEKESDDHRLTFTISLPTTIQMGTPFSLIVLVVNESKQSRTLRLHPLLETEAAAPPPNESSSAARSVNAPMIQDERGLRDLLVARPSSGGPLATVCLDTETVVSQLEPGTCHEARLRFICFQAGTMVIQGLCVTDEQSHEMVTIDNLPQAECTEA